MIRRRSGVSRLCGEAIDACRGSARPTNSSRDQRAKIFSNVHDALKNLGFANSVFGFTGKRKYVQAKRVAMKVLSVDKSAAVPNNQREACRSLAAD